MSPPDVGVVAELLGLDSSAWTAIGTVSLGMVTIAYVIVTGRIASRSREATEAAERSANAAERTAEATEAAAAEERERRRQEAEASRVQLMRGLLAEIRENLDMAEVPTDIPFHLPFVRDVWASAKERVGGLPDEVVDAVRHAYAEAATSDRGGEWRIRVQGANVEAATQKRVAEATELLHDRARGSFEAAASVLEHWIRMKESPDGIEPREGPTL